MPPTVQFSKKDLVKATFNVISKKGLSAVTARNVAAELGSSTMPVYANYRSIDELIKDALEETLEFLKTLCSERRSIHEIADIGMGIAIFARDYPKLFHSFFFSESSSQKLLSRLDQWARQVMRNVRGYSELPEERFDWLIERYWYYIFGLASTIYSSRLKPTDDEIEIALLNFGMAMKSYYLDNPKAPSLPPEVQHRLSRPKLSARPIGGPTGSKQKKSEKSGKKNK